MLEDFSNREVGAIIVLYCPDCDILTKGLEALLPQVGRIVLVDNTPETDNSGLFRHPRITYLSLGENRGIAAAQNEGIRILFQDSAVDYILFSDQDSLFHEHVVKKLVLAHKALRQHQVKVGALGCRFYNRQTGEPYRTHLGEIENIPAERFHTGSSLSACYWVISSGSIIHKEAFLQNGGFDEALFIDGVDDEWCWRAWHNLKLKTFIVNDAMLAHSLGEENRSIGNRTVSISSSFRVYYQFRNFLWMYPLKQTPRFWKKRNGIKYAVKAFYFPLMCRPRLKYLTNILRGIKDGIIKGRWYRSMTHYPDFNELKN